MATAKGQGPKTGTLPDLCPVTFDLDLVQLAPSDQFPCPGWPVGDLAGVHVNLDFAVREVASNQFLRERVLDVPLDGATERTGAVRTVLARDVDDPVHDVAVDGDLHPAIDQVRVQLVDQEPHDAPQVIV